MKIVLAGGSGQVGVVLARAFERDGHQPIVLSRQPRADAPWRSVTWDGATLGDWVEELEDADAIVNLAGRSVDCRYNRANRRAMMDSRVHSTRIIGEALARLRQPPRVWLQSSTATIYAHRHDAPNDELTGILGGNEPDLPDTWRFSIDVATSWEHEVDSAPASSTRRVKLRSAMIMSPDKGGIFDTLVGLVRWGLGGRAGDGRQYVSWIHEVDFVRAIYWLVEHDVSGAVNLASPNPLPYDDFMRALREAAGVRIGLPATKWMLELGAFLMRTETELILKSRRVVPGRLVAAGFTFDYPTWPQACAELMTRWRAPVKPVVPV